MTMGTAASDLEYVGETVKYCGHHYFNPANPLCISLYPEVFYKGYHDRRGKRLNGRSMNMKRKVKQVIALACGFGLLCSSAQAATLIGYDAATRTLQIKGDFAESAAGTATFSILPAGVDPQSVDAETANAADMLYRTVAVQDDGSVTSTIVLPGGF